MKNFNNLIAMAHVMRHNSQTAVNPDGRTTVNRQSKLTSYRGWCKKLTMILAVLVLSIGQMWGATGDLTSPYTLTFDNTTGGISATMASDKSVSTDAAGAKATGDAIKTTWTVSLADNGTALAKNSNGLKVGNGNTTNVYDATFSSSSFSSFTITQIDVKVKNNSSNNSGNAMTTTTTVTVGGEAFDEAKSITNTTTATVLTFKPATGKSGNITINIANTGTYINHYYVQYIKVTFTASAGGGCGSTEQAALTLSSNSETICGTGTATFTVSGGSGSGALSVSSSDASKATASISGSTVTVTGVAAGSATITVTKACDATYAEKTATYSATVAAIPTANAGADKVTEPGTGVALAATAAADGCTGAWTIESGPNTATNQLSSTSSATATFTPTVAGTYTLRWTVTNTSSSCSAYDEMTVTAAVCSISDCGNATLTYPLNVGTSLVNTAANLVNTPSNGGSAALTVPAASAAVTLSTITISAKDGDKNNNGKAAATTSACYPTAPTMSSKIGMFNGSSYSSSNYLQFAFTVNSGYTFTPCDIQFTVQPVSSAGNFRWEVTDGTNIYGYGVATDVPVGSSGGASVMTGLTSTTEMAAGDYYIRLYPYYNGSNTFRISNNVILKGTTAAAAPSCTAPSSVAISGTSSYLPGQNISLTAAATGGSGTPTTYQWYHRGVAIDGATSATYTKSNCTIDDAGNYTCKVTMGGSCSTTSPNFAVRVYSVKVWSNGGGSVIGNYPLTYQSSNNGRAVISTLSASTTYEFKVIDNVGGTSDSTIYYGNGGTIHHNTAIDPATWDFGSTTATNCKLVTGVETGDFTFDVDITHNGTGAGFYVTVNVAYPTKTIYLTPGVWNAEGAKFAIHYYDANGGTGWTDFLTANDCGMSAEIPVWDGVKMIAGRFNSTKVSTGNWDDKWNQTNDITVSSYNSVVITGWDAINYTYNSNFSTPTYTISYNKGTNGTGSKANETKTCGVDFTLPGSTFTYAGHTQDGWATTDGGTIAYALSGSYTTNDDEEFFPHWKCNTPTITDNGNNTVTITVPAGTTVRYTTDGSTPTSSTGTVYSSAIDIAANVTIKAIAYQSNCTDSEVASQACTYHAPAASLTAISADVLYQAADMANITFTGSDQYWAGLSTNNCFKTYGNGTSNSAKGKTITSTNVTDDIGTKSFTSHAFIEGSDVTSGTNDPTYGAIEFITPSTAGLLYVYTVDGSSSNLKLRKKGSSTFTALTGSSNYNAIAVDANSNYYIHGNAGKRGLYGIQYVSTYAVSITTTNVTKATGEATAIKGKAYEATFTANTGYTLPSDVTVTIGGASCTKGTEYTWSVSSGTGTLTVKAANVTGNIVVSVAGVAAATYALNYECNGAESGCPSNTTASALPNPLPSAPTKDGYTFGGWFTDEDLTVEAVAGAAMTEATTLYAKWTVNSSSECITITNFATTNSSNTLNVYKGTISDANKYLGKTTSSNTVGKNSGADLLLKYKSSITIYNAPAAETNFTNITEIHFDVKANDNTKRSGFEVYVGATKVATISGGDGGSTVFNKDSYTTLDVTGLEQLTGYVRITSTSSSGAAGYDTYIDNIQICTSSLTPCTTPVIPTLSNQSLCEGGNATAWNATITNSLATGESVAYSWTKKGNSTVLSSVATYQPTSVTEAMAGTYVVTATVSADSKASATATQEVTLSVTDGIEVTAITADKATVYPTNSVTLTATASADATWKWYTCTNAEGAGEVIIDEATSASYTIASAGSAGTYYYKVKATGSCGTGSMVYALTVSPAASSANCFHYVSVIPTGSDIAISSNASIVTPTHATTLEGGTMKVGSSQVNITKNYGLKLESSKTVIITLESALEAGNVVIVKGTTATAGYGVTINGVNFYDEDNKSFDVSYTVVADDGLEGKTVLTVSKYSGSSYLQEIKITGCGTACTDPEVTASVNNSTACVGSSVTFTATGAHASATYRWQKYSGGAWMDIANATAATYTIPSVATTDAMKYRVIARNDCDRTSNEVTLNVPVAPVFNSFTATRSVMATLALSITDVEASDATSYAWYKSADATYDAGTDTKVGTTQELLLASGGEASGATYYLFCVASNACGSTTSSAITVNVTAFVEEDCATKGNEDEAEFGFENTSCGSGNFPNTSTPCWNTNSKSKYLTYTAPEGKYFDKAKVTVGVSGGTQAAYGYSTDGSSWTYVTLTGLTTSLAEKEIDLTGNITYFRIGRNFDPSYGQTSNTFYLSKACFEYTESCTATEVVRSTGSASYDYTYPAAFAKPTFALQKASDHSALAGTLTYSSSNADIATVDDDGDVDFTGLTGTVTITVAFAGGTISTVDYCASQTTYTITVNCSDVQPKITTSGSSITCQASITLNAVQQSGSAFADGTFQWYRDGVEIEGATSASYTATRAGIYTVSRTATCTKMSSNSVNITSDNTEPEVTRLTPFQYYHVDSVYRATSIMRYRHLFTVKGSTAYGSTGKNFKMELSRNGGDAVDVTTQSSIIVTHNADNTVDTVLLDLNALDGKYTENDELVLTCKAIACGGAVSETYKESITVYVINKTKPTLALICSGSNKASGTRKTSELTVGGDFLTGYNVADLCQQTGNTSFDANTEWGLYTRLKENYIVTPVNGYAVFNILNYEPFDILLLTDYPKASKSDAAATVLDDMADLCDYRPMLSFKAHMVAKSPSKWAAKGFTTSPVVPKNTRTRLNIVCYAHPMFSTLKSTATHIQKDNDDPSQIVYTMLTGAGYEGSKGLQGFELEAAENFVTIGLVHYNATPTDGSPSAGLVTWAPGSEDRMLVTAVERQENIEARMIMFAVNCGAQSKFTETGRNVVLKCLEYLLDDDPLHVADCSFTFDNGAGNSMTADEQAEACESCTGTKGDGKWSTAANWGPDYVVRPGKDTEVKIAAPVIVDPAVGAGAATNFTPKVRSVRILEGGKVEIPAGSYLEVVSTIRRQDGNEIYPTEVEDLHIGSSETGNGTLIFNNNSGDTKAQVDMYSKGFIDGSDEKNFQYIGTPFNEVNALYNYYGSWIYYWNGTNWKVVKNGGPMTAWTGYCITQEAPTYHQMSGTLTATGTVDIPVGAGQDMVVGNSWTAPIDIQNFADDDFENLEGSVYFFNTGVEKEHTMTGHENDGTDRYAGGTYVTVPIHSAPYSGDDHIPSLQGFFVTSNGSAGTLHLDYDKLVRNRTRTSALSGAMHAPARRAVASTNEPTVLKIKVSGTNYDDKLLLLEREDFTSGYDKGWDGDKWDGNESALYLYAPDNAGTENSVMAVPELEGTIIGFRAGEEDDAYTLNFEYLNSDEPLYLYDSENSTYTRIMTGVTYRFFTTDKSKHARFIITRKSPQITTAVGEVPSDEVRSTKAKKLLLDNKLFILRNGMLYDATGKVVK